MVCGSSGVARLAAARLVSNAERKTPHLWQRTDFRGLILCPVVGWQGGGQGGRFWGLDWGVDWRLDLGSIWRTGGVVWQMCLAAHDGGMPLYDFTALSCDEIGLATQEGRSSSKWQDDMVPVARNPEGDLLVVHAKGVSTWSGEDGLGSVEAVSLAAYLEGYRNKMLGGHVEYVEDCGIMELSTWGALHCAIMTAVKLQVDRHTWCNVALQRYYATHHLRCTILKPLYLTTLCVLNTSTTLSALHHQNVCFKLVKLAPVATVTGGISFWRINYAKHSDAATSQFLWQAYWFVSHLQ